MTIKAAVSVEPAILSLDSVLDLVIKEIFMQIMNTMEQPVKTQTSAVISLMFKNRAELLRCFTDLANRYSDKLVPFLLQKLEQNNEKPRSAALTVLQHLINSQKENMLNKQQLVVSGMRLLINETDNKVKSKRG